MQKSVGLCSLRGFYSSALILNTVLSARWNHLNYLKSYSTSSKTDESNLNSNNHAKPKEDLTKSRKVIELKDSELDEKWIKGGGSGGQKINKSSTCVQLKHIPTGITVKVKGSPTATTIAVILVVAVIGEILILTT